MKIRDGRGGLELDYNQRQNDERLQDLERRLKRAYKQAGEGVKEKLADFMAQFAEADAHMLEAVEAGEITQAAYIEWRRNNILRSRQLEEQITSMTNDLLNADRIAVDMINGDLPEVYASSYNFGLYRSDIQAMAAGQYTGASFTAYNADALRILQEEDPDLIPWDRAALNESVDLQWNRAHIQNAVMQGILQGDSITELTSRIQRVVDMDNNTATRTARTSYTSVQNQARREATQRARDNGYNMTETWYSVLQDNTRDTHLLLNGTHPNAEGLFGDGIIASGHLLRWPGDPQGDPEQIYNCQCRVSSYLDGVDHSRDAELYAEFMQQNYPADWFGDDNREGVVNYRREETARALERRRQLMAGERENRETAAYLRRQQAQEARNATTFTPATDITSAANYAQERFTGGSGFTLTNHTVNYNGLDLEVANGINEQLTTLYDNYNIPPLTSLEAFGRRDRRIYARNGEAPFFTTNFGNIGINTTLVGNASSIAQYAADGEASFNYVMQNIDRLTGAQRRLAEAYRTAGRSLVDNSLGGMVTHEIGHHITYSGDLNRAFGAIQRADNWQPYAAHISGYANASFGEYCAESFTAYVNGERDILQPEMLAIFDGLRR